jgi:FkbM family methyltransferase
MQTRSARLFKEVVYSEKGRKVKFQPTGFTGGIEDHSNRTKGWHEHEESETVEFVTTTLDDILSRAEAPGFIECMSIDIEGAELEALKGLSFSRYTVGAFTIEHNWEEPKRSEIRQLLESKDYRYALPRGRDDFYIYSGLLKRSETSGFQ